MTPHARAARGSRTRPSEIAFLLFGASVFALSALAYATYCIACAYPATVTAVS